MMKYLSLILLGLIGFTSCNKDGCIDPTALNYDPNAENDDGTCVYLAENLNLSVYSKLGQADFAYNTEVITDGGRTIKFTRAQMYMSGFTFNGTGGAYQLLNPHALIKPEVMEYNLGYLPQDMYTSFSFSAGVDSASNHMDPATFSAASALSSNNPDHMHWGWDPGYIFYVLEGLVDTSAAMNGLVDAPFIFHVGTDMHRVDLAFVSQIDATSDSVNVSINIDWLKLLDGTDMTAEVDSRSTHTTNNPPLAALMVTNLDEAISLHQ